MGEARPAEGRKVTLGEDTEEDNEAGKGSGYHILEALGCPKALYFLDRQ